MFKEEKFGMCIAGNSKFKDDVKEFILKTLEIHDP
jgi:hypothetical protein